MQHARIPLADLCHPNPLELLEVQEAQADALHRSTVRLACDGSKVSEAFYHGPWVWATAAILFITGDPGPNCSELIPIALAWLFDPCP